ncbi:uncharacterized protein LOC131934899 isoform X2 [Physella acuta]|uniref:uncharacterized protein LOC131934899 isoform X2 n=1 Tax=Physella acuta TaxID=109671 RepID=UPI0027DDC0F5|nr:uncharacterized protein LOC131934899 isoform X2 [Physella acuta]
MRDVCVDSPTSKATCLSEREPEENPCSQKHTESQSFDFIIIPSLNSDCDQDQLPPFIAAVVKLTRKTLRPNIRRARSRRSRNSLSRLASGQLDSDLFRSASCHAGVRSKGHKSASFKNIRKSLSYGKLPSVVGHCWNREDIGDSVDTCWNREDIGDSVDTCWNREDIGDSVDTCWNREDIGDSVDTCWNREDIGDSVDTCWNREDIGDSVDTCWNREDIGDSVDTCWNREDIGDSLDTCWDHQVFRALPEKVELDVNTTECCCTVKEEILSQHTKPHQQTSYYTEDVFASLEKLVVTYDMESEQVSETQNIGDGTGCVNDAGDTAQLKAAVQDYDPIYDFAIEFANKHGYGYVVFVEGDPKKVRRNKPKRGNNAASTLYVSEINKDYRWPVRLVKSAKTFESQRPRRCGSLDARDCVINHMHIVESAQRDIAMVKKISRDMNAMKALLDERASDQAARLKKPQKRRSTSRRAKTSPTSTFVNSAAPAIEVDDAKCSTSAEKRTCAEKTKPEEATEIKEEILKSAPLDTYMEYLSDICHKIYQEPCVTKPASNDGSETKQKPDQGDATSVEGPTLHPVKSTEGKPQKTNSRHGNLKLKTKETEFLKKYYSRYQSNEKNLSKNNDDELQANYNKSSNENNTKGVVSTLPRLGGKTTKEYRLFNSISATIFRETQLAQKNFGELDANSTLPVTRIDCVHVEDASQQTKHPGMNLPYQVYGIVKQKSPSKYLKSAPFRDSVCRTRCTTHMKGLSNYRNPAAIMDDSTIKFTGSTGSCPNLASQVKRGRNLKLMNPPLKILLNVPGGSSIKGDSADKELPKELKSPDWGDGVVASPSKEEEGNSILNIDKKFSSDTELLASVTKRKHCLVDPVIGTYDSDQSNSSSPIMKDTTPFFLSEAKTSANNNKSEVYHPNPHDSRGECSYSYVEKQEGGNCNNNSLPEMQCATEKKDASAQAIHEISQNLNLPEEEGKKCVKRSSEEQFHLPVLAQKSTNTLNHRKSAVGYDTHIPAVVSGANHSSRNLRPHEISSDINYESPHSPTELFLCSAELRSTPVLLGKHNKRRPTRLSPVKSSTHAHACFYAQGDTLPGKDGNILLAPTKLNSFSKRFATDRKSDNTDNKMKDINNTENKVTNIKKGSAKKLCTDASTQRPTLIPKPKTSRNSPHCPQPALDNPQEATVPTLNTFSAEYYHSKENENNSADVCDDDQVTDGKRKRSFNFRFDRFLDNTSRDSSPCNSRANVNSNAIPRSKSDDSCCRRTKISYDEELLREISSLLETCSSELVLPTGAALENDSSKQNENSSHLMNRGILLRSQDAGRSLQLMNTHCGSRNRETSRSRRGQWSGVHFDSSQPEEDNNLPVDCEENFTSSQFDQNCPAKDGEDASKTFRQTLSQYTPFSVPLCPTTENYWNTTASDPLPPLCLADGVTTTADPRLQNQLGDTDDMMDYEQPNVTMETQPGLVSHGNNLDEMYKYLDSLWQRSQYHVNERFESMRNSINERLEDLQNIVERRFSKTCNLIKNNGSSEPAGVIQLNTTQSKGNDQVFGHPLDVSKYRKAKPRKKKECVNSPDMSGASCSAFPTIKFNEVQSDQGSLVCLPCGAVQGALTRAPDQRQEGQRVDTCDVETSCSPSGLEPTTKRRAKPRKTPATYASVVQRQGDGNTPRISYTKRSSGNSHYLKHSRSCRRRQASGDTCCNLCLSSSRRRRHSTPARRVTKHKVGTRLARRPRRNTTKTAVKRKRPKTSRVKARSRARQTKPRVFRSPKLAKRSTKITAVYRRKRSAQGKQSRAAARNKTYNNKYGKTRSTGSSAKGKSQRGKAKRKTNAPKRKVTKYVVTPLGHKAMYENLLAQHEQLKRSRCQHSHSLNDGEIDKVVDAFRRVISGFPRNKIQKLEKIILRAQVRSRKMNNRARLSPSRRYRVCVDRQNRSNNTKSNASVQVSESLQSSVHNSVDKSAHNMSHDEESDDESNQSNKSCRQKGDTTVDTKNKESSEDNLFNPSPLKITRPRKRATYTRKRTTYPRKKTSSPRKKVPKPRKKVKYPRRGGVHLRTVDSLILLREKRRKEKAKLRALVRAASKATQTNSPRLTRSMADKTKPRLVGSPELARGSNKSAALYRTNNRNALRKQSRAAAKNKTCNNKYGKTRSTRPSAKGKSQRGKAKRKTNAPKRRVTKYVVTPLGHKAMYENLLAQHEQLKRTACCLCHSLTAPDVDKVVGAFKGVVSELPRNKILKLEKIILRAQIRSRKMHNRKWLSPARQHRCCGDRQTRGNNTKSNAAESLQGTVLYNCVGKHNPLMARNEYLNQSHVPCRQYTAPPIPDRDEDEADTRVARTSPQRSTHPRPVDSLCLIRKKLLRHQDKTTNATLDIPECLPCLFPAVGGHHSMIIKTKFSGGNPDPIRSSESSTDLRNLPPYIYVSSSASSEYFSCEEDVSRVDCTSRGDVESSGHLAMESGQVLRPETVGCTTVQGSSGATDDRASKTHSTVGDSTAVASNHEDNVVIQRSTGCRKSSANINVSNQQFNITASAEQLRNRSNSHIINDPPELLANRSTANAVVMSEHSRIGSNPTARVPEQELTNSSTADKTVSLTDRPDSDTPVAVEQLMDSTSDSTNIVQPTPVSANQTRDGAGGGLAPVPGSSRPQLKKPNVVAKASMWEGFGPSSSKKPTSYLMRSPEPSATVNVNPSQNVSTQRVVEVATPGSDQCEAQSALRVLEPQAEPAKPQPSISELPNVSANNVGGALSETDQTTKSKELGLQDRGAAFIPRTSRLKTLVLRQPASKDNAILENTANVTPVASVAENLVGEDSMMEDFVPSTSTRQTSQLPSPEPSATLNVNPSQNVSTQRVVEVATPGSDQCEAQPLPRVLEPQAEPAKPQPSIIEPPKATANNVGGALSEPPKATANNVGGALSEPPKATANNVGGALSEPPKATANNVGGALSEPPKATANNVGGALSEPPKATANNVGAVLSEPPKATANNVGGALSEPPKATANNVGGALSEPPKATANNVGGTMNATDQTTKPKALGIQNWGASFIPRTLRVKSSVSKQPARKSKPTTPVAVSPTTWFDLTPSTGADSSGNGGVNNTTDDAVVTRTAGEVDRISPSTQHSPGSFMPIRSPSVYVTAPSSPVQDIDDDYNSAVGTQSPVSAHQNLTENQNALETAFAFLKKRVTFQDGRPCGNEENNVLAPDGAIAHSSGLLFGQANESFNNYTQMGETSRAYLDSMASNDQTTSGGAFRCYRGSPTAGASSSGREASEHPASFQQAYFKVHTPGLSTTWTCQRMDSSATPMSWTVNGQSLNSISHGSVSGNPGLSPSRQVHDRVPEADTSLDTAGTSTQMLDGVARRPSALEVQRSSGHVDGVENNNNATVSNLSPIGFFHQANCPSFAELAAAGCSSTFPDKSNTYSFSSDSQTNSMSSEDLNSPLVSRKRCAGLALSQKLAPPLKIPRLNLSPSHLQYRTSQRDGILMRREKLQQMRETKHMKYLHEREEERQKMLDEKKTLPETSREAATSAHHSDADSESSV